MILNQLNPNLQGLHQKSKVFPAANSPSLAHQMPPSEMDLDLPVASAELTKRTPERARVTDRKGTVLLQKM
jgi:hypothetical protein